MEVISYFNCINKEYWLKQIEKSDWSAGKYLFELLKSETFFQVVGNESQVLMLTENDKLISFCTLSEYDDIRPTKYSPWIGFVYTFPVYRGNRYFGLLFKHIEDICKQNNIKKVYISTDAIGLYEKYGCSFKTQMKDIHGNMSRVYIKEIN